MGRKKKAILEGGRGREKIGRKNFGGARTKKKKSSLCPFLFILSYSL
jgi:hypothetical protein